MTTIDKSRRRFLQGSLAAGAGLALGPGPFMSSAWAQSYPARPIEALIPFSPGGGTDRSVRVVTPAWAEALGMSRGFRLNHQSGAGTLIAQNQLNAAAPDGYTVIFTPAPHTAWLSVLQQDDFDINQIAWLGSYFQDPNVLLVANDSPYQTAQDLIEDARATGRTLTASVSSPMSAAHAATVVLRERAGINIRVVPFGGGSDARNAVAGGHVDCCMAPYWSATHVLELTRALCIFAPEDPSEGLWDAPPAAEALDFEMPNLHEPYAAQVSAATRDQAPEAYERLVKTFREALASETFRAAAREQSLHFFTGYWAPERCQQFIDEYLTLLAEYRPMMERDLEEM